MADSDISKMKVADLKRELKNRGKSTVGNKTELTERLQAALIEGDTTLDESVLNDDILDDDELNELNDELDDENHEIDSNHEDAVLKTPPESIKSKSPDLAVNTPLSDASTQKKVILKRKLIVAVPSDTTPVNEPLTTPTLKSRKISITSPSINDKPFGISVLPTTVALPTAGDADTADSKKVIKLSELTAKERLELRAKKFGAPIAVESLKLARSERFGLTATASTDSKTESDSSSGNTKNGNNSASTVDILKKRAERFGGSVSKEMNKIENLEKLQKRSERFGKADNNKITVSGGSTTSDEMAEKARLRLERFKTTVA